MRGSLSEFTLGQLLQFFALAERTGTIRVKTADRESRLLVEGDRIVGWGDDDFNVREPLLECELLSGSTRQAIQDVSPRPDTPGLSFIVRNLVEPSRWDAFAQRQLEQDIYPLLSAEDGDFEIQIMRNPPAPLRLSIPINSMILDGSRWESEMEAAALEGFPLTSRWQRSTIAGHKNPLTLSGLEWIVWASVREPQTIADIAQQLGVPDLATIGAVKRLRTLELIEEVT